MVEEIAPKKQTVRGNKERISKLSPEKSLSIFLVTNDDNLDSLVNFDIKINIEKSKKFDLLYVLSSQCWERSL